jgi:hypothetical protein
VSRALPAQAGFVGAHVVGGMAQLMDRLERQGGPPSLPRSGKDLEEPVGLQERCRSA